jgi:uncharacterized pyridoxamine 5'-phosphate oxidase family protein
MNKICSLLKESATYHVAFIDDGKIRCYLVGAAVVFKSKLYMQVTKYGEVSEQIKTNPHIIISTEVEDAVMVVEATAINDNNDNNDKIKRIMFNKYPVVRNIHKIEDDDVWIFFLKDAVATVESFKGKKKVIKF